MSGIFLSYRRDDSSGWAGRLHEHLVERWGTDHVFMDIDTIAPGEDFRHAIRRTMETCDVVLVVIGPAWAEAHDGDGGRRLADPHDTHRAEIVAALAADVRVVPVLVGGATMPRASDLPEPLQELAYRNAAVLEDRSFVRDVHALNGALERSTTPSGRTEAAGDPDRAPTSRRHEHDAPARAARPGPRPTASRRAAPSRSHPQGRAAVPTALAGLGTAVVLVWGAVVPRDWHDELWGIRVAAAAALVVVAVTGVLRQRWHLVLAGGLAGLLGLVLWILQLLATGHSGADLLSAGTDGVPNGLALAGAATVAVAGLLGVARHDVGRAPPTGTPRR